MADSAFVNLILKAKNLLSRPVVEAKEDTQELSTELEKLTAELNANEKAQKAISKNSALNDQLEAVTASVEKARVELEDLEKAYQQTAGPAKKLANEVAAANRTVVSSEKNYKSLSAELDDLNQQLKIAGAAERDLAAEQAELANSSTMLKSELKQTNATLATLGKNKALETQLAKDGKALEEAEKQLKKYTTRADGMKKPTKEVTELIRLHRKQVSLATTAYDKTNQKLENYKSELETLGVSTETLGDAEEALKIKRIQSTKKINELAAATKKLKVVQDAQAKSEKLSAKADALNKTLKEQKSLLAELQAKYKATAKPTKELEQAYADAQVSLKKYLSQQDKLKIDLAANNAALRKAGVETDKLGAAEKRLAKEHAELIARTKKLKEAERDRSNSNRDAASNTDLLTKATRRLAQIYTVIIASEKALGAVKASVGNYGDLEAAITRVEKTTGTAREQVAGMAAQLQDLANEATPTATNELLRYAEVAGQLGAKSADDIMNLVTAADALAVSTDLAGDEAVSMLTRILSMTGEDAAANIHNLSSTVVELGNNFAASESEIVHMTKEMATGTASISMSAQANAAFGVTLKENGQQAERSRSAMFEMAQVIKKAATEGGKSLVDLMNVTGMTADAIEANLKDRPEQVMLAFVKGLNKIKVEGGLVSATLGEFGITGKEATSVIEILSDNHTRLAGAIDMANKAYVAGNAHLDEASKAYADQDASIQRLMNKFTELQAKVGAAYSDDVKEGVDGISQLFDEQSDYVIELAQVVGDLGAGLVEVVTDIGDAFSLLSGSGSQVGVLMKSLMAIKATFNEITIAVNWLYLGLQQVGLAIGKVFGASEEEVARAEKAIEETVKNINRDLKDLAVATAIFNGESSRSYEGLKNTVAKYGDVISTMTQREQLQIKGLMKKGAYLAENNDLYNQLNATIIRQARLKQAEAERDKQQAARNTLRMKKEQAAAVEKEKSAKELAELMAQVGNSVEALAKKEAALNRQRQAGFVTEQEYQRQLQLLDAAEKKLIENGGKLLKSKKEAAALTLQSIPVTASMTDQIEETAKAINKEYEALNELQVAQVGANKASKEYKQRQLEIEVIEDRIARKKADMAAIQELEGKRLSELIQIKKEHDLWLKKLSDDYANSIITISEYQEQLDASAAKTAFLTQAVGEQSKSLKEQNDALDKNRDKWVNRATASESIVKTALAERQALNEAAAATDNAARKQHKARDGARGLATAFMATAEQSDLAALSIDGLSDKITELEGRIYQNRQVSSEWFDDISRQQMAFDQQSLAIANQTKKLRELEAAFDSTETPTLAMIQRAELATKTLKRLDDSQLSNLRAQIDSAREKMLALQDSAAAALASVQDELDRENGNLEAIEQRKLDSKLKELDTQLAAAKAANNRQAIADLNQTIKLTKQLNDQKVEQIRIEKAASLASSADSGTADNSATAQDAVPTTASRPVVSNELITVRLEAANKAVDVEVSSEDKDDFLFILTQSGTITR